MKEFPSNLNPKNKDNFSKLNRDRLKCYLRRDIYEYVISRNSESDYFSLDDYNQRANNSQLVMQLVKELVPELEHLGWKCKTSFGGTGLFIYSTDMPPPNCFEDSNQFN